MFEDDYVPVEDTVLRDRAYDALREAPDMSEEMDMVMRGEMKAEEFERMTSRQDVGIEAFKLNRSAGSVIPIVYNDGLAVTCDSNQRSFVCNMALIEKLMAVASTEEGWNKLSTTSLKDCPVVTPDTVLSVLPSIIDGILYADATMPKVAGCYAEISNRGDVGVVLEVLRDFDVGFNLQEVTISGANTVLDVYANMNTVGELFTAEQFIKMLECMTMVSKTFACDQEAIYLRLITETSSIIHRGYMIVGLASEGLFPEPEPIATLSRAAKYVEGTARLVGYASILSGRVNALLGEVNRAVE